MNEKLGCLTFSFHNIEMGSKLWSARSRVCNMQFRSHKWQFSSLNKFSSEILLFFFPFLLTPHEKKKNLPHPGEIGLEPSMSALLVKKKVFLEHDAATTMQLLCFSPDLMGSFRMVRPCQTVTQSPKRFWNIWLYSLVTNYDEHLKQNWRMLESPAAPPVLLSASCLPPSSF